MANSVQFNGGAAFLHYISGLLVSWLTTTTIRVGLGQCENYTSSALLNVRETITIDFATVGAGGLDTGAIAANTWYYIYLIGGAQVGVSAIASLSAVAPALPAGYSTYRKIDAVRTLAAAATLMPFAKSGSGRDRQTTWLEADNAQFLLSGGVAVVATDVACASMLPTGATRLIVTMRAFNSDPLVAVAALIQKKGQVVATSWVVMESATGADQVRLLQIACDTDAAQKLQYLVTAATTALDIIATGYEETV